MAQLLYGSRTERCLSTLTLLLVKCFSLLLCSHFLVAVCNLCYPVANIFVRLHLSCDLCNALYLSFIFSLFVFCLPLHTHISIHDLIVCHCVCLGSGGAFFYCYVELYMRNSCLSRIGICLMCCTLRINFDLLV